VIAKKNSISLLSETRGEQLIIKCHHGAVYCKGHVTEGRSEMGLQAGTQGDVSRAHC